MVEYKAKSVTLSKGQIQKLAKGKKVRLTNKALSGGNEKVYLTGQQMRKVETRLRKGVGMDIGPFDERQIKHNTQHGSGLWDSIKRAARDVVKDLAKQGVNLAVDKGGEFLKDSATGYIDSKLGSGVKRGRKGRKGGSIFGDILKVGLPILLGSGKGKAKGRGGKRGGMIGYTRPKRGGTLIGTLIDKANRRTVPFVPDDVIRPPRQVGASFRLP